MTRSEFPLPQELIELIVSYISHDIPSLRRLLTVCRAFAPIARKYLYRDIILLDDKNDPAKRSVQTAHVLTISEASFIDLLPSVGHLVKSVRIRGSTRCTKQKSYVASKWLHLILPRLVSLQSISFQRTRPGPECRRIWVRRRHEPYMLMTTEIARAIPRGVHTVWLSKVKFEREAAADAFFGACRELTHLGLDHVSVLANKEGSLSGRFAKRVRSIISPPAPSLPLDVAPIELRSYAHGSCVDLPRLPFTDSENAPYFKLSSVTSLKLHDWDSMLMTYWETLVRDIASSAQDVMIVTALFANVYRPNSLYRLAGHKPLRSLCIVMFDVVPETLFPNNLQSLIILIYGKHQVVWSELDAYLDHFPFVSSVEIFLLDLYSPPAYLVDFFSSIGDYETACEWEEEIFRAMPLLSQRGILIVKQLKDINR